MVAQSILTLLRKADSDPDAAARASQIALWSIDHMQDRQGYFYYQAGHWMTHRIPYLRWGQAWMLRALTALAAFF